MINEPDITHILLVDDEPEVLNALRRLFRGKNYQVYLANSGAEGIDVLRENTIDIVISDVRMPKMSGTDFLKTVFTEWPEVKRIVLTGHADFSETLKLVNDCQLFRYFHKPWQKDDLKAAVDQAAEQRRLYKENIALQALTQKQNAQLQKLNQMLDEKVKKSTSELQITTEKLNDELLIEKQLRQARIEADEANEAKSRFLATMSHEIRSPLNAILVMNNLLLESTLNDEQKEHAKLAHHAGQILLSLINDILDFSKIESGELSLHNQWFNLKNLANTTHKILSSQADIKGIEFKLNLDDNINGLFHADEIRLKQILINMLSNAIKFTESGHVALNIYKEAPNSLLVIQIEDSGIGIPLKQQNRIFSEFVQVEDDANRRFGGTGLGLSIVKQLVIKMGGAIKLISTPGIGSTFTVTLPLPHKISTEEHINPVKEKAKLLDQYHNKSSILLVEDSPANVAVIQALLKKYNLDITIANNGRKAIEECVKKTFDIILMDLSMPVMDGLEATRIIRHKAGLNQNTPIIAMTANAFIEDKIKCFEVGMNEYISKPIDTNVFFKSLNTWLSNSKITTPNQPKSERPLSGNSNTEACAISEVNHEDVLLDTTTINRLIQDVTLDATLTIFDLYTTETQSRIELMQSLLTDKDWSSIQNEAHALKSSSGSFGLTKLQSTAKSIELGNTETNGQKIINQVQALSSIYNDSITAIKTHFLTLKTAG
ncbi:response regulator [Algibacillus agarilyticus]|uniref:response regulator n=1 Tax=Algibacillus agarilyticus TaxID=2234133 RepID=UPI0018E59A55|nr:response regulator [Algibacillus agarilyticus]